MAMAAVWTHQGLEADLDQRVLHIAVTVLRKHFVGQHLRTLSAGPDSPEAL